MRVAFVCPELRGHLHPTLRLAREFQALGHEAVLIARPSARHLAELSGVGYLRYGSDPSTAEALGHAKPGMDSVHKLAAYLYEAAEDALGEGPELLRGFDGVVVDELLEAWPLLAARTGIPCAAICNALPSQPDPYHPPPFWGWDVGGSFNESWLGQARNLASWWWVGRALRPLRKLLRAYMREHGLRPGYEAVVAQLPAELDPPRKLPRLFECTGAWCTSDEDLPDGGSLGIPVDMRPYTYASSGTLVSGGAMATYAAGLAALDGSRLIVSTGRGRAAGAWEHAMAMESGLPETARVRPWVAHHRLIQDAAHVVHHGGLNTTLACIAAGKPQTILPQAFEQPGIAARVRALRTA